MDEEEEDDMERESLLNKSESFIEENESNLPINQSRIEEEKEKIKKVKLDEAEALIPMDSKN